MRELEREMSGLELVWWIQAIPWIVMSIGGALVAFLTWFLLSGLSLIAVMLCLIGLCLMYRDYKMYASRNSTR